MFAHIGRWCYHHRWLVLGLWVLAFFVLGGLNGALGTRTMTEFTLPDVESRRGMDIFEEHFDGQGAGATAPIVFQADQGVEDPEVQNAMEELFAAVEDPATIPAVDDADRREAFEEWAEFAEDKDIEATLVSPYSSEGEQQIARSGDLAGQVAYANVEMPSDSAWEDTQVMGNHLRDVAQEVDGLDVYVGGVLFAEWEEPTAEFVGVAFAIFILIIAFGSVIAMGLPIGTGVAGIGLGTIVAGLASHLFEVPDFAQMLGFMIGLGVGIDYALFIVTRFRENRRAGQDMEAAIVTAMSTAGRAVAFAGGTVVVSLLGMVIMQLAFITGMAIHASIVVAVTMVAALTLLPALMSLVGERIEVTRWRGVIAASFVAIALLGVAFSVPALTFIGLPVAVVVLLAGLALRPLKRELPARRQKPVEQTVAYRWSRLIQHHPWPAALVGAAVLVVLALPVLGIRLGFSDEGNFAEETDARKAYDLLADGFGPGNNGPVLLATELPSGTNPADMGAVMEALMAGEPVSELEGVDETAVTLGMVTETLQARDDVASASPPRPNDEEAPTAAMWQVIPASSPQDQETTDLVKDLRSTVLPQVTEGSELDVAVAGTVAVNVDFTDYLGDRLLFFFAAVLALSFLLLMVVFRSVLVPLKAVIMNLLGIGAAYGVIIAGFQWGWLGPVLNLDGGPIEPFMPMMLFAIVFGLSMDYEVFLISRIREDWDRTGDSHTSVANGLAATARVITAAALIMIVVFASFALVDDRVARMAGIGLAAAVFLDATIIRMLLVPATMELLGDRNWWLPGWLDRVLPHIEVEGHVEPGQGPGEAGEEERELERV